jgi:hypothetical protein
MMKFRSMLALAALAVLASGCQNTTIRSAWYDTDFGGPPMKKIVVSGSVNTTTASRVFEDTFVARLRAAGVDAVAGHTLRLGDAGQSDKSFGDAVVNTGAQGLLFVALLDVDTRTHVSTTMVSGGMGWGRGPWGGTGNTMVAVREARQYDLATVETKLVDVGMNRVVWAATTSTFNPGSVARETPGFAELIIGQLADRGIISRQ